MYFKMIVEIDVGIGDTQRRNSIKCQTNVQNIFGYTDIPTIHSLYVTQQQATKVK